MKSGKAARTNKRVSIATKNGSNNIQPVLYSFRVTGGKPGSGSVMTAIRPPYWLYHDHALGVIWALFHRDKNYIGITQLHWCLRFLLDLKNSQGEYTGDVEICIRLIQDDLVEKYARLGTAIDTSIESKSLETGKDSTSVNAETTKNQDVEKSVELTEGSSVNNVEKHQSIVIQQGDDIANSTMLESVDPKINNGEDKETENASATTPQETAETSIPSSNDKSKTSEINGNDGKEKDSEKNCSPTMCQNSAREKKKIDEMVSFVYNEMLSSGPKPCADQDSIADFPEESGFFDITKDETFDQSKPIEDRDRTNFADLSTKEMMTFLNSSRQQHIERIKKEIERLYGLERFMENLNADEFSAYVTEDLARRMKTLKNEDIVKSAGEITRAKQ